MTNDARDLLRIPSELRTRPASKFWLRATYALLALVAMALALGVMLLVLPSVRDWLWRRSFDSTAWKSANFQDFRNDARLAMVDDLLSSGTLDSLDESSVAAVLGPPDPNPYLLVEQPRHKDAWIYRLGPDHLALDSMWLVLTWTPDRHVRDATVVSD